MTFGAQAGRFGWLAGALAVLASLTCSAAAALPLLPVGNLPLPGNPTRLDYQSLDAGRHLLFIAHLGNSDVIVVDTKARRVVTVVPNVSEVHGVLAVPQLHTVYASATGSNEVVAIDESSLKITARTSGGVYPDGIAFDPNTKRLFVSDERGRTETVIDTRPNRRIATIELGGEVGNSQYDPATHHIFANVQTLGQLVEIDPRQNRIVRRISLARATCIGNHGLLIDASTRRAFIACEESATVVWVDMRTMRIVASWPTGEDPDVLAYDPSTRRLFVASESGDVSMFLNGRSVARIAQAFLAPAAHTVAVDSDARLVYFPLENKGGRPQLLIMRE